MKETINFRLKKPAQEDFYNIDDFNTNADIIDAELRKNADGLIGKADLVGGKIPESQLPAYVSDIIEASTRSAFPATGKSNTIYIALDTGITYRWSGTQYSIISDTIALGETAQTAYRGDRGKTAYEHSIITGNPHNMPIDDALSDTSTNPVQNKAVNAGFAQKGNTQTYIINDVATLTVPVASWVANTNAQAEAQEKTDFLFMATIPIAANLVGGKAITTEDGGRVDPKYTDQISGNYCLNAYTVAGGVLVECVAKPTAPLVLNYIEIVRRLS